MCAWRMMFSCLIDYFKHTDVQICNCFYLINHKKCRQVSQYRWLRYLVSQYHLVKGKCNFIAKDWTATPGKGYIPQSGCHSFIIYWECCCSLGRIHRFRDSWMLFSWFIKRDQLHIWRWDCINYLVKNCSWLTEYYIFI